MADQAGQSIDALRAHGDAVASRWEATADADRRLADALSAAHRATATATQHLDRIEAEIDTAVQVQLKLALDTAAGAHAFARFLLDKQHEIVSVVTTAQAEAEAKTAVLQQLRHSYHTP